MQTAGARCNVASGAVCGTLISADDGAFTVQQANAAGQIRVPFGTATNMQIVASCLGQGLPSKDLACATFRRRPPTQRSIPVPIQDDRVDLVVRPNRQRGRVGCSPAGLL